MSRRRRVNHYHEPGHFHEFTFACSGWLPLLAKDFLKKALAKRIDEAGWIEKFDLVAFVFLPNYVRLITYPHLPQPAFDGYLVRIKQLFSSEIRDELFARQFMLQQQLVVTERSGNRTFRFWQRGSNHHRSLATKSALLEAIESIHNQPVQSRLRKHAIQWKWSSARYHLLRPSRQQFPGLPHVHGIPRCASELIRES